MHSVNVAFLTDLFIRTNKDPKFCFIWARKHSVATSLLVLRYSGTQGTWELKPLKPFGYSKHSGTWALKALWHLGHWGTFFSRLQGTPFTGILSMFAEFHDCHWMLTLRNYYGTLPYFNWTCLKYLLRWLAATTTSSEF